MFILYIILFGNSLKGVTDRSFLEESNLCYPYDKDSHSHEHTVKKRKFQSTESFIAASLLALFSPSWPNASSTKYPGHLVI